MNSVVAEPEKLYRWQQEPLAVKKEQPPQRATRYVGLPQGILQHFDDFGL